MPTGGSNRGAGAVGRTSAQTTRLSPPNDAKPDDGVGRQGVLKEIERLETQLEELAREINEQGGLRESGEQGEYFEERARIEERLGVLRRMLNPTRGEELTPAESAVLGRRFTIRLADGSTESWELTTPREANPRAGRISVRSPLGRALVGKSAGETAEVVTPEETYTAAVVAVE